MKMSNELKTGGVIFAALFILIVMLYKTGDLSIGKRGYTVSTRLGFAAGVKKFAPVRLSGVEVGEVRDLKLIYESDRTWIQAVLWVGDGVKLRQDSLAVVSTLGLMGEKYIEIKAGTAPDFVAAGGEIPSKDPVSMEDLFEQFQGLGKEFEGTLGDVRKFVNNLNGVVGDNKDKIGRIMDNLELTTEYFVEFAEDVSHHPWKVLSKGKELTREELEKLRAERIAKKINLTVPPPASATSSSAAASAPAETAPKKAGVLNFATPKK